MFTDVINRLKKLFGKESIKKSEIEQAEELGYVIKYEDVTEFNIISIIANKLSNIVCSEVSAEVVPANSENKNGKIDFLDNALQKCVSKLHLIAVRAFGIGGVILKPYIYDNKIYTDIIPQNRFFIIKQHGEIITKAGFIADVFCDEKAKKKYVRIEYHSLDSNNIYTIENKIVAQTPVSGYGAPGASRPTSTTPFQKWAKNKDYEEIALSKTIWADMPQRVIITNVEQMLFAFVKCPSDNKKESCAAGSAIYGAPITYGQDKLIKMILDLLNEIPEEYKNKKAFIGADDLLFDKDSKLPESGLYKLFRSGGGIDTQSFWEIFSPEIRHASYFEGLDYLFGLLEKAVSVNKGILTDMNVSNATATAIKRSTLDTFSTVYAMRKNIEVAAGQLIYAFGIIADAFDLCSKSTKEYSVKFDWNYGLLEDSAETWNQYLEGYNAGAVKLEELRMYLFNEDRETAKSLIKHSPNDVFGGAPGAARPTESIEENL
ncbi:MAG: hypothetical protein FWF92_02520 [Oscillospiraceae bacterium]|nr:hypothetical protein [Oscillospiraceae bacterium]